MDDRQPLDGFDLYERSLVYKKIDTERYVEAHTLELDPDRPLAGNGITKRDKLASKHGFINAFEQSWPKIAMHPQSQIENVTLIWSMSLTSSPRLRVSA